MLIQILDQAWKDHLLAMDQLRGGVGLAGFAEKDPRIVFKKEGFAFFEQMLSGIRDKVTDLIFRVKLEGRAEARSQYRETAAVHEDTGGYGVAENLQATAGVEKGSYGARTTTPARAGREVCAKSRHDRPRCAEGRPQRSLPLRKREEVCKKCHGRFTVV